MSESKMLNEDKLKEVKDNFNFFDRDGNGEIDLKEFTELLKVLSPQSNEEQAEKGFSLIDSNGDGHIDFEEFIGWWNTCWWEY
ncbi:EF-hand domain-containing protein [Pleionea sp. CnH1-48]|uniref:EF-hand domain-containing protein n=1 Tax=Pleionea sp. CnH1-48 TaxID=2954494 RepID=UPI002097CCA1|nr:EF-hand domain-containing protein [Pleionea sp. CnH1-48]MCO7226010.1 EF-hand domain-containing protein [Pleionea sp. CnH1-48]